MKRLIMLPSGRSEVPQPPCLISRTRLLEQLPANWRVLFLHAPAGYGKTTFARQLTEHCDCPTLWLMCPETDPGPRGLFQYLSYGARQLVPPSPTAGGLTDGTSTCASGKGSAMARIAQLCQQLTTLSPFVVLVLDDVQNLRSPRSLAWLRNLIQQAPDGVRFVIASRTQPELATTKMALQGDLHILDAQALALDEREVHEVLAPLHGGLAESTLHPWIQLLEGWPAGLGLLVQQAAHGATAAQISAATEAYLEQEVLSRFHPKQIAHLHDLAISEHVTPYLARMICPDNDVMGVIELACQHGVLRASSDHTDTWIFPAWWQHILRRRLDRYRQPAEIRALHGRAAKGYLSLGRFADALGHAMQAGDENLVLSILVEQGPALYASGHTRIVRDALAGLGHARIASHPTLVLLAGQVALAMQLTDDVESLARQRLTRTGDLKAFGCDALHPALALMYAQSCMIREAHEEASRILGHLNALRPGLSPEHQARILAMEAELAICQGRYEDARAGFELAAMQAGEAGDTPHRIWSHAQQAEIALYQGDLARARQLCQKVFEASGATGTLFSPAVEFAGRVHVTIQTEWLRLNDARQTCERILSALQSYPLHLSVPLRIRLALIHLLGDNTESACRALEATESTLMSGTCHTDWHTLYDYAWLRLQYRLGNRTALERWLGRHTPFGCPRNHYELRDHLNHVYALVTLNQHSAAIQQVRALADTSALNALPYPRLQIHILAALACAAERDLEHAAAYLGKALIDSERARACAAWLWLKDEVYDLFSALEAAGLTPSGSVSTLRVKALIRQSGACSTRRGHAPEAARVAALTHKECVVLDALAQGLSQKEIAAHLHIEPSTVKSHIKRIYRKLGVHCREDACRAARQIEPDSGGHLDR